LENAEVVLDVAEVSLHDVVSATTACSRSGSIESFTVWIMGCPLSPLKPARLAALERPLT
jgi:hypothetical protein